MKSWAKIYTTLRNESRARQTLCIASYLQIAIQWTSEWERSRTKPDIIPALCFVPVLPSPMNDLGRVLLPAASFSSTFPRKFELQICAIDWHRVAGRSTCVQTGLSTLTLLWLRHWQMPANLVSLCRRKKLNYQQRPLHASSYRQLFLYQECKTQTFPRDTAARLDFVAISLSRWR